MSEEVQRRARDRRDGALDREERALERAERNLERGDPMLARRHKHSAERHAAAAAAAEFQRRADVAVEGERLGEPAPRAESSG